jgi:nicotinate-nucleotide--dimethylbenzimidazole phosphoribosyltransferase
VSELAVTARRSLILGGARSGKSAHAEGLLPADQPARYLATARIDPGDAEWTARIEAHRARRPPSWRTVEAPDLAAELLRPDDDPILVDDLATWLTGRLDDVDGWDGAPGALASVTAQVGALVDAVRRCPARLVLVSAEVGLGVVPATRSGRLFRDELGALNARLAEVCDEVLLLVAGIPVTLRRRAPDPPADTEPTTEASRAGGVLDFPAITPPDEQAGRRAATRHTQLTKPAGSLGRLEELGVWLAACQGTSPPRPLDRPRVVVFAGDHGVARHGVSAYPSEVTAQMVANFLAGGAAVNVLASVAGASVRVVDLAVDCPALPTVPDQVTRHKVRRSSGRIDIEDALTDAEAAAAVAAGRATADEEVDDGADLLIAGDMGIGNTTPASVLVAALTGAEPVAVVGRGTGIDDAGWMRKTAAVRDALRRARPVARDPLALLRTAGGADLAGIAGFLAQAAVRRTPVLLDGLVVGAAALVAEELAPGAKAWWLAGHRSVEPAHQLVLDHLGLAPLLELDMRLGEGSGALAALPLVTMAGRVLSDMATFADAGVSGATDPAEVPPERGDTPAAAPGERASADSAHPGSG